MKSFGSFGRRIAVLMAAAACAVITACSPVPAGNVGVLVSKYGDDRGVQMEVKGPGRHYVGWNQELHLFPTFTQNTTWEGGNSFVFQTSEGSKLNTAIGVSYLVPSENAPKVFQKYRMGIDEVTNVYLKAMIRDALTNEGSKMLAEDAYGAKREDLQTKVQDKVKAAAAEVGLAVEKVFFIGQMELPPSIVQSINNKIAATQIAQQKENELRATEADAKKAVAAAEGEAKAAKIRGEALRSNPQVLEQLALEKWDGKLPQVMGSGATPFVDLRSVAGK